MASIEEMGNFLLEMGFSDIEVDCALQATEYKVICLDPASYFQYIIFSRYCIFKTLLIA